MTVSGPIFDRVESVLNGTEPYGRFKGGGLSFDDYVSFLDSKRKALVVGGVPDEDVDYAKRYPPDRARFLRSALALLRERGVIAHGHVDFRLLDEARRRSRNFDHGGRTTYIYPEESDLLAALADITRPCHVAFLGSYYGFWACAALPALLRDGGTATLVDPDPDCSALASLNFKAEIAGGRVTIACATGEALLARAGPPLDMVVIDAELPRDDPDEARRGKGVYASLLEAALPRLAPGAVVVSHNILLDDWTGAPVFDQILARNQRELARFGELAQRHLPNWTVIHSTEGLGVGSLPRAGS